MVICLNWCFQIMPKNTITHNIEFHVISSDHSRSQGLIERLHSSLIEQIKLFKLQPNFRNDDIQLLMLYALAAYNNSIVNTTRLTPHEIVTGHVETEKFLKTSDQPTTQAYVAKHKEYCRKLYDLVHHRLEANKIKYIRKANKTRELAPEKQPKQVLQRLTRGRKKTQPRFVKKIVQEQVDPKTLIVKNPRNPVGIKVRLDQLKRLPRKFHVADAPVPTASDPGTSSKT